MEHPPRNANSLLDDLNRQKNRQELNLADK